MSVDSKHIEILSYAVALGGARPGSAEGPTVFQQSLYATKLEEAGLLPQWQPVIAQPSLVPSKLHTISQLCRHLAASVKMLVQKQRYFLVLGGDHTSAIGTWSGAAEALSLNGPLGLIWIDAHMDSHTPQTTRSGNIHGMPLACLLGQGAPELIEVGSVNPAIHPQHLCLIGIRSFEKAEEELLQRLNVRIFYMEEVKRKGLKQVLQEALQIVNQGTAGFGVSIDIDSIDPVDAPGTGVASPNGLKAEELYEALKLLHNHPQLIGIEIAEFDPQLDIENKTEKLISSLVTAISVGK